MNLKFSEEKKVTFSLGLLVALIGFVVTLTVSATSWKETLDSRIYVLENQAREQNEVVESVEIRQHEQDVVFAEILTDLKWIRATLEDRK